MSKIEENKSDCQSQQIDQEQIIGDESSISPKKNNKNMHKMKLRRKTEPLKDSTNDIPAGFGNNFFEIEEYKEWHPNRSTVHDKDKLALRKSVHLIKDFESFEQRALDEVPKSVHPLGDPEFELFYKASKKKPYLTYKFEEYLQMKHDYDAIVGKKETEKKYTNQDLFLVKTDCVIRKTWEVENRGMDSWPENTKIVPELPNLEGKVPRIIPHVDPGDKVRITAIVKITDEILESIKTSGNKFFELKFYFITRKKKIFGESLRIYGEYDEDKFDEEWEKLNLGQDGYKYCEKIYKDRTWLLKDYKF